MYLPPEAKIILREVGQAVRRIGSNLYAGPQECQENASWEALMSYCLAVPWKLLGASGWLLPGRLWRVAV